MTLRVRPARPDDSSFIDMLGIATALDTVSQARAISRPSAEAAFRRLRSYCKERADALTFIAERDGERAGFLILLTDAPDEITQERQAFVAYLAVDAAHRSQGVGRVLLGAAMTEGQRRGLPHISLMVSADNEAARALYESEHFMQDRILMSRPLQAL